MRKLLITGQRRSGTTLTAKLLNAQASLRVYSDFLHIDRIRRHLKVATLSQTLTLDERQELKRHFLSTEKNRIEKGEIPEWEAYPFKTLNIDSLIVFYEKALEGLASENDQVIGHKSTMAQGILEDLLTTCSDALAIYVIRDPRDVVNSSLARQQKDAGFEKSNKNVFGWIQEWADAESTVQRIRSNPAIRDRLLIVRYEDLVREEQTTYRQLAAFLGLEQLDVPEDLHYRAGVTPNDSSFAPLVKALDTSPIGRWKKVNPEVGRITEVVLHKSMQTHGYAVSKPIGDIDHAYVQRLYFQHLLSQQYAYLLNESVFQRYLAIRELTPQREKNFRAGYSKYGTAEPGLRNGRGLSFTDKFYGFSVSKRHYYGNRATL